MATYFVLVVKSQGDVSGARQKSMRRTQAQPHVTRSQPIGFAPATFLWLSMPLPITKNLLKSPPLARFLIPRHVFIHFRILKIYAECLDLQLQCQAVLSSDWSSQESQGLDSLNRRLPGQWEAS